MIVPTTVLQAYLYSQSGSDGVIFFQFTEIATGDYVSYAAESYDPSNTNVWWIFQSSISPHFHSSEPVRDLFFYFIFVEANTQGTQMWAEGRKVNEPDIYYCMIFFHMIPYDLLLKKLSRCASSLYLTKDYRRSNRFLP